MSNDIESLVLTLVLFDRRIIMEILNYLCLLLLNQITIYGVSSKHVHLRILVPDVTNHHVHTRTVLLHLRVPAPKKPKVYKTRDYHHANWSSWKYGRHRDYEHEHENDPDLDHENHHKDHEQRLRENRLENHERHRQKHIPAYDYYKDSYRPPSYIDDNDLEQKDRDKDTYAVHEDVNDLPPNTETVVYDYEEGYRKGLETETGHVRSDRMHKFHEDQEEDQGDTENEGFKEEFGTKTDSGRYLVDDVEWYENTRDKRDHRRRSRKRIDETPRIVNRRRNRNKW